MLLGYSFFLLLLVGVLLGEESAEEAYDHQEPGPPHHESYSFHEFNGPVSGEVQQIVNPQSNQPDFVAKPEYSFAYGVQDPKTGNSQTHSEARNGNAVQGEYRVLQSDGVVRIVKYTADPHLGFQATVEYA